MKNVPINPGFDHLCIIHSLNVTESDVSDFESYIKERCDVQVQFLETYKTLPDKVNGIVVPDTGDRSDVIFAVRNDEIQKLNIGHRLDLGIRWLEDALGNDPDIYEQRIHDYLNDALG